MVRPRKPIPLLRRDSPRQCASRTSSPPPGPAYELGAAAVHAAAQWRPRVARLAEEHSAARPRGLHRGLVLACGPRAQPLVRGHHMDALAQPPAAPGPMSAHACRGARTAAPRRHMQAPPLAPDATDALLSFLAGQGGNAQRRSLLDRPACGRVLQQGMGMQTLSSFG
jgi:hypothetical protein